MRLSIIASLLASSLLAGCATLPATVEHDPSLPHVELDGYKFHVRTYGNPENPPVIVVHGGPGGDLNYLLPLQILADDYFVVFYDQRGTGLSPRTAKENLTFEASLKDLHLLVAHYAGDRPVRLIGHSWGAMLAIAYLGEHPDRVSHAVAAEPGILTPATAEVFVSRLKASQSLLDALPLAGSIVRSALVRTTDGHERFDYAMTRLMNRSKPGGPYQCEGQAMPADAFVRAGYDSFKHMLKPVLDTPSSFRWNLTEKLGRYGGSLLMMSSECSFIGHAYQQEHHLPLLPARTVHVLAKGMGHNMLTLNAQWSAKVVRDFFKDAAPAPRVDAKAEK
ncbi:alpha/beta fold hydrolase [Caldimonas tepidiphila]|uniref:alpha/beta fold hydrolase n=1 Tax=Caldimonas tepidiphila TaxID=2315841 RepID=UPI000E5A9C03|nr:alpha/beta hydrolase [Caldimonas tepidiphila]